MPYFSHCCCSLPSDLMNTISSHVARLIVCIENNIMSNGTAAEEHEQPANVSYNGHSCRVFFFKQHVSMFNFYFYYCSYIIEKIVMHFRNFMGYIEEGYHYLHTRYLSHAAWLTSCCADKDASWCTSHPSCPYHYTYYPAPPSLHWHGSPFTYCTTSYSLLCYPLPFPPIFLQFFIFSFTFISFLL